MAYARGGRRQAMPMGDEKKQVCRFFVKTGVCTRYKSKLTKKICGVLVFLTICFLITGNYSVAGFELTLRRKISHYIITYYLPSGMFVIVSWISFLVPADIVPGRMTLLVTVFLVLVNIFNTITTNIPKAEGKAK